MLRVMAGLFGVFFFTHLMAEVPECGSSEVTDLVEEIAHENFVSAIGVAAAQQLDGEFVFSVTSIRTVDVNSFTGSRTCVADLHLTEIPEVVKPFFMAHDLIVQRVEYTVEVTDDEEEVYVTVYWE